MNCAVGNPVIPGQMRAWVLGNPGELALVEKPVPQPGPAEAPARVDIAYLVSNNIYVFGIRGEGRSATHRAAALMQQGRFDASLIHTHTFPLQEVPTAIRYSRERVDDAIKIVVKLRHRCRGSGHDRKRGAFTVRSREHQPEERSWVHRNWHRAGSLHSLPR